VFNLGSGRSLSINQLAEHVVRAFGHAPGGYAINYAPARAGEQRRVQADVRHARAVLGWQARTTFEAGLAETVAQARAAFAAAPSAAAVAGGAAR
jgi:nucleoside-diphosphate-sugar epimerase